MNYLKTIFHIAAQNFRKWQTDYRIWTIAVFLLILTLMCADDFKTLADFLDNKAPVWIFPFLYMSSTAKVLFTLPVILLYCDAPFIDKNQMFVMMRTSRTKWLCGQIIYIISAGGVYYFFIFAVSVLSVIFSGEPSFEWDKVIVTAAYDSSVLVKADVASLTISRTTVEFFTPLLACFYTFIMSWLSAVFLGLLIFACNLFTGSRIWGIASSSFFVVLTLVAKLRKYLDRFSPVTWSSLDGIDVGGLTVRPSIGYCTSAYAVLIIGLTAAIFAFGRKKSLDVMKGYLL